MQWKKNRDRNRKIVELFHSGMTYNEISAHLGCSKSIISYYCSRLRDEERKRKCMCTPKRKASRRKATAQNAKNWEEKKKAEADIAMSEWENAKNDPEMMAFLGLYWGEGFKASSYSGVVNSDSGAIVLAIKVMSRLSSKPIRAEVRFFPTHCELECKKFWEEKLKMKVDTYARKFSGTKHKTRSAYGTCVVAINDWKLRAKIMTWLDCLRNEYRL